MTTEQPTASGMLDVGDGQRMYWEEWGNRAGVPALYLHGGPGGTLNTSNYRQHFDLTRTRLVSFEQRGCGRSTPHAGIIGPAGFVASLDAQTVPGLVADIELLREHLGVDAWVVSGASWGSTLAIAYLQAHPHRVRAAVLVAVTSSRRREIDWITEGVGAIFPEAWDRFASFAENAGVGYRRGHSPLVAAYASLLNDPATADAASREWALWEDTHISIGTGGLRRDPRWQNDQFRIAFARLATHYWAYDYIIDHPLLDSVAAVGDTPAVLIHGRRDVSGPAETAWELHRRWPASQLIVDEGEGHGGPAMGKAWRAANDRFIAAGQ